MSSGSSQNLYSLISNAKRKYTRSLSHPSIVPVNPSSTKTSLSAPNIKTNTLPDIKRKDPSPKLSKIPFFKSSSPRGSCTAPKSEPQKIDVLEMKRMHREQALAARNGGKLPVTRTTSDPQKMFDPNKSVFQRGNTYIKEDAAIRMSSPPFSYTPRSPKYVSTTITTRLISTKNVIKKSISIPTSITVHSPTASRNCKSILKARMRTPSPLDNMKKMHTRSEATLSSPQPESISPKRISFQSMKSPLQKEMTFVSEPNCFSPEQKQQPRSSNDNSDCVGITEDIEFPFLDEKPEIDGVTIIRALNECRNILKKLCTAAAMVEKRMSRLQKQVRQLCNELEESFLMLPNDQLEVREALIDRMRRLMDLQSEVSEQLAILKVLNDQIKQHGDTQKDLENIQKMYNSKVDDIKRTLSQCPKENSENGPNLNTSRQQKINSSMSEEEPPPSGHGLTTQLVGMNSEGAAGSDSKCTTNRDIDDQIGKQYCRINLESSRFNVTQQKINSSTSEEEPSPTGRGLTTQLAGMNLEGAADSDSKYITNRDRDDQIGKQYRRINLGNRRCDVTQENLRSPNPEIGAQSLSMQMHLRNPNQKIGVQSTPTQSYLRSSENETDLSTTSDQVHLSSAEQGTSSSSKSKQSTTNATDTKVKSKFQKNKRLLKPKMNITNPHSDNELDREKPRRLSKSRMMLGDFDTDWCARSISDVRLNKSKVEPGDAIRNPNNKRSVRTLTKKKPSTAYCETEYL